MIQRLKAGNEAEPSETVQNGAGTCHQIGTQTTRGNPASFPARYELIDKFGKVVGEFDSATSAADFAAGAWPRDIPSWSSMLSAGPTNRCKRALKAQLERDKMNQIQAEIFGEVEKIDPNLKRTDPHFMHHAILLSCLRCGPDEALIAKVLEYDREFVEQVGSRLRTSGIWNGDCIATNHFEAWRDPEMGGVSFGMDAAVAAGDMIVVRVDGGEPKYSLTPAGLSRVKKLMKGKPA